MSLALAASMLSSTCGNGTTEAHVWAIGTIAVEAKDAFLKGHRQWVEETGRADVEWIG